MNAKESNVKSACAMSASVTVASWCLWIIHEMNCLYRAIISFNWATIELPWRPVGFSCSDTVSVTGEWSQLPAHTLDKPDKIAKGYDTNYMRSQGRGGVGDQPKATLSSCSERALTFILGTYLTPQSLLSWSSGYFRKTFRTQHSEKLTNSIISLIRWLTSLTFRVVCM